MIGASLGPYHILAKLGEGGPPSFALELARTPARLAEAR